MFEQGRYFFWNTITGVRDFPGINRPLPGLFRYPLLWKKGT